VVLIQGSLFGHEAPDVDPTFVDLMRVELDATSWVDVAPGWLRGHEVVFDELLTQLPWRQRTVTMYERRLPEPRLTWWWTAEDGPEPLPVLAVARNVLDERYGVAFDSIGFNCYRRGEDSVESLLFGLEKMGYLAEEDGRYRVGNWFFDRWLKRVEAARVNEARP